MTHAYRHKKWTKYAMVEVKLDGMNAIKLKSNGIIDIKLEYNDRSCQKISCLHTRLGIKTKRSSDKEKKKQD